MLAWPALRPWRKLDRGVFRKLDGGCLYFSVWLHLDTGAVHSGVFSVEQGQDDRDALDRMLAWILRDRRGPSGLVVIDYGASEYLRGPSVPNAEPSWLNPVKWRDPR